MKKLIQQLNQVYMVLLIIFIFSGNLFSQNYPEKSPLNPDFIKYLEDRDKGLIKTQTLEGYGLGHIPSPVMLNFENLDITKSASKDLPSSYDMRLENDGNWLSPVGNQGAAGTCWAFATTGAIESYWLKNGKPAFQLSEQNMATCHGFDWNPVDGGNYYISTAYLARGDGPISEDDDPYTLPNNLECSEGYSPVAYVGQARFLSGKNAANFDVDVIKRAIMDYGAIYTNMRFEDFYYNPDDYTFYYDGQDNSNHAVLLVGWDDNKVVTGRPAMATPPGVGAWIIKNSWGANWGEQGYFYISYYDSQNLTSVAYFPDYIEQKNDLDIYYYNKFGFIGSIGWGANGEGTGFGLTKFSVTEDQVLQKIGTYVGDADAIIDIEIFQNFDGYNLTGLLGKLENQTCTLPGYHSFALNEPINLENGDSFYVKVKYNTGTDYPIPSEWAHEGYNSNVIYAKGKNWASNDGESFWLALGEGTGNLYNLTIKAYASTSYNLTLTASPNEGGNVNGQGNYAQGTEVNLSALPNEGYAFVNWTDADDNEISNTADFIYTMPANDFSLTANFSLLDYELTVNMNPDNAGILSIDPEKDYYNIGDRITFSATNNEGYLFQNWREADIAISSENIYTYTMPAKDVAITAYFIADNAVLHTLTLETNPTEGGKAFGGGSFLEGETVNILAVANDGYLFVNWTDKDDDIISESEQYEFQMTDESITYTANFEAINYELAVNTNPENAGNITVSPEQDHYNVNNIINIQTTINDGYEFINWTDEYGTILSSDEQFDFTMPAKNAKVTANFSMIDYELNVEIFPQGAATVNLYPDLDYYKVNNEIYLVANANEGFELANWSYNDEVIGEEDDLEFTMPASDVTISANFTYIDYKLTVKADDNEKGEVSVNPKKDFYYVGDKVTLTASPNEGFLFVSWTNQERDVESREMEFVYTMPPADATITANFKKDGVSVQEIIAENVRIYPNPARNNFTVESNIKIEQIIIIDISGQEIKNVNVNELKYDFDSSNLKAGVYFVQIYTKASVITEKIQIIN